MNIKNILVSQPAPADLEKSPYRNLINEHHLNITFFKFFDVVGVPVSEFRRTRIHLTEYTAVIFNSRHSVDHYFRLAKELRAVIPDTMKYFCSTESIALYLQNYIQYRKRRIFFGNQHFADLLDVMNKHRGEKLLFPCSDEKQTEYTKMLDKAKFKYTRAPMYRSVPKDMSQFNLDDFDLVAVFSPIGVRSLLQNFPDIKERNIMIAALGTATHAALNAAGLPITIAAPTKSAPSMAMAIENYLLGKEPEAVIVAKPALLKPKPTQSHGRGGGSGTTGVGGRKTKSVIASRAKYKQLMEEKKAKAAARRAARAAERARKEAEAAAKEAATNAENNAATDGGK